MTKKAGKLQPSKAAGVFRAATFSDVATDEDNAVDGTIATEAPVQVFDFSRGAVVDEVLLLDGMEHPRQIPIVDSHDRSTVRNILVSIRSLSVADGKFTGRAYFSRRPEAQAVLRDIQDGHITDFSITAQPTDVEFVPDGHVATVRGREFTGPQKLVKSSRAVDGSVVAVGADQNAKVNQHDVTRRAYFSPYVVREEHEMDQLRKYASDHGMPADFEGDVLRWLQDNVQPAAETSPAAQVGHAEVERAEPQAAAAEVGDEVQRAVDIRDICERHSVSSTEANQWIKDGKSVDEVARLVLDRHSGNAVEPVGQLVPAESEHDKFCDAVSHGLAMRCLQSAKVNPQMALQRANGVYGEGDAAVSTGHADADAIQRSQALVQMFSKPAPGANDFRYAGLSDIARQFCERAGIKTYNLPKHEVVRRAMQLQPVMRADGAYHTTGSFSNVLLDAANKTLLAAYDEAGVTYPIWVRTAPSAADYKSLNRIRFGELADPGIVPENHEYQEGTVSDNKETYNVEKRGSIFSISLEAVVNDDLNAISRIPQMQGNAMRRAINRAVYAVLTANADLSDGVALFHATSHGANLDATALAAGALDTGFQVMMTQSGISADSILNLQPRFLIVPAALSATALQLANSTANPAVGGDTTGSSGVVNLYGPGGPRTIIPVIDGQLDGSSTTAWWLAADSSQVDTVELTFLQGEESPVLERQDGFEVDAVKYKIRQSFAAAAVDYRGLYQGNS